MYSIANIVALCLGLAGSHRGIIKDLWYNSVALQDKREELCKIQDVYSIPACCFFEAYKTDLGRITQVEVSVFKLTGKS